MSHDSIAGRRFDWVGLLPADAVLGADCLSHRCACPHPDDETLGAGALIATLRARGASVVVVAAADGENCYDTSVDDRCCLAQIREGEQRRALGRLGVAPEQIVRLRLKDSGLHHQETEIAQQLGPLVQPGMQLIAPWTSDFHPDHGACGRVAASVAREKGANLISYFFWT